MVKAPALLLLSLALAGCAAGPQAHLGSDPAFKPDAYAWDGAGENPNRPKLASPTPRNAHAATRASFGQDGTEPDQDAQLSRSLVICKGCIRPQPSDDARLAKASD
ncbi:hypothetical protein C2U70_16755 [Bradyrhizobium guangdongense]|uniref:hypothetical protein n=1 Tax=Bradyrhizobium guangdongense TaxID=1325090 RepID=UPI00112E3142|nr:hypothetical protein [Bradyrhizobium guangdongense]TPQ34572.1 hypothetical protein C2U70_16755 [Bradyrhizobium guangdongense]